MIAGVSEDDFIPLGEFFSRIKRACTSQNTERVARQMQVSRTTVERWLDERYAPHPKLRLTFLKKLEKQ